MKKQILILTLLLPLLAGCTAKQPEPLPCTPGEAQRLVVYTSHKEEVYTPIIREFEERTGIWVDVVSGGTNELLQRIQQEADELHKYILYGMRLVGRRGLHYAHPKAYQAAHSRRYHGYEHRGARAP